MKRSLMELKSIDGKFGLDDNFDNYINGKLCFSENGSICLVLSDSFSDGISEAFKEIHEVVERPIIKGYGNNGKYYELIDCCSMGGKINFGGLIQPIVNYGCKYLFEYQCREIKDKNFSKISFEIDKLNQWCDTNPCAKMTNVESPLLFEIRDNRYWEKEKEDIKYYISNGFRTNGEENVELNFSFNYAISIEYPPQQIDIDHIQNFIHKMLDFKDLITLFINERAHINKISIIGGQGENVYFANLYCNAIEETRECKINSQKRCGMIGLSQVQDNLLDLFDNYFGQKEKMAGSVHSVLTLSDIKKHRKVDVTNYVKQTATAIEGFMRNCRRVLIEEPKKDFEDRINRILENQTEEDKVWLEKILKYSNQATFRKQLTKLINELKLKFPELTKEIFGTKKQRLDLIERFVNTRNFYTHYDVETKQQMLGTLMQVNFCDYINELLRLLLLSEIGIDLETLIKANKHNQLLTSAKNNLLKSYLEENDG